MSVERDSNEILAARELEWREGSNEVLIENECGEGL